MSINQEKLQHAILSGRAEELDAAIATQDEVVTADALAAVTPKTANSVMVADRNGQAVERVRMIDLSLYADVTGTSDATAGVQQALTDAGAQVGSNPGITLYAPANSRFKISDSLLVPDTLKNSFRLVGDGPLGCLFDAATIGAKPVFVVDPNTTPSTATRRQYWRLENIFINGPGKGVAGSVGLRLDNCLLGYLLHVVVTNFETGVWLDALNLTNGAAMYYNDFYNLVVTNCATGLLADNQANSNRFFGGRIGINDKGIQINPMTDNVEFFGTDIEGNGSASTPAVVIAGYGNGMYGVRLENPGATYDIKFDDSGGGSNGIKNTVDAYFANVSPESRVQWDANRDNTVRWPGWLNLGNASSTLATSVVHATRSAAADGKPFLDLQESYAGSGSPIGMRYRQRRLGDILVSEFSADGTTWYQSLVVRMNHSTGKSEIVFGSNTSVALDTNLYRNGADQLKTDDKFLAAAGIGVGNSAAATTPGTVVKKIEVFDANGVSLGFIPVYDSIN